MCPIIADGLHIKAAGEEFGIIDRVESLNSLASELKKSKLTVEEAKTGLKMVIVFQGCGIKQDGYPDLIQTCAKMKSEDTAKAAVELNQLENATGKTWKEIITEATNAHQDLKQTQSQLAIIIDKLEISQEQLVTIENEIQLADKDLLAHLKKVGSEKKQASQDLADHIKQVSVDMDRLALMEDLATALKEQLVSDGDLKQYIKRQKYLDQAGINLDNLVAIVKQTKVMTEDDEGEALAEKLYQFGSLDSAIDAHQNKLNLLTEEIAGLEEKAKLKAKIETDIFKLQAERATLESVVTELAAMEKKLDKVQHDITDLLNKQEILIQDIKQKEDSRGQLDEEIADKEQKVSDLSKLEAKRKTVLDMLAELEAKKEIEMIEREVFESFLGIVGSSLSVEAMEKFVAGSPQLFALAKAKEYSPELLRRVIIRDLSGGTLEILHCSSCNVRFYVDKPTKDFYTVQHCQLCGSSLVETDVTGPEIIKKALATLAQQVVIATPVIPKKGTTKKNLGQL